MINLAIFLVIVLLVTLLVWLIIFSFLSKKRPAHWLGTVVTAALVLLLMGVSAYSARSWWMLYLPTPDPVMRIQVQATADLFHRQPHLTYGVPKGCTSYQDNLGQTGSPVTDTSPVIATTEDYGHCIVTIMGCKSCHNANLSANQTSIPTNHDLAVVKGWTEDQFMVAMQTGTLPEGNHLSENMPWKIYGELDDAVLQAAYQNLH